MQQIAHSKAYPCATRLQPCAQHAIHRRDDLRCNSTKDDHAADDVIRMISERQIPAYVQTMKLYESETGVETKGVRVRYHQDGRARRQPFHFP